MGERDVAAEVDDGARRAFTRAVLRDLEALELMIERGMVESGVKRVGMEQEMFLVDESGHSAAGAYDVLEQLLGDGRFQSEVALFNLEANLGVRSLSGAFLREMEHELLEVLDAARSAAARVGLDVILSGTLPSLRRNDVVPANLTPEIRYQNLNRATLAAQGGEIYIAVDGTDRFEHRFDSVVIEGANTSIQLHLQVDAGQAARLYNLAQLILAPVLAAASNSPVLLGKRVWPETRVAVFERALDDRSSSQLARALPTRVGFGSAWLKDSLVELFHDNVSRYPAIMIRSLDEDPVAMVEAGQTPRLHALTLHNGTVWRWNRPCYGITNGKPHLRIESRILPSGPTAIDEIANAALFYGLMLSLEHEYADVSQRLSFADARSNFLASATSGLDAEFRWLDDRSVGARTLLLDELLPLARVGLAQVNVSNDDIARYMNVIERRVATGRTGSSWLLEGLAKVSAAQRERACLAAVQLMRKEDYQTLPVHQWPDMVTDDDTPHSPPVSVSEVMTRDVFTVHPDDVIELAASMMRWKHIRHIPVEDDQGHLVGVLGVREVLRLHGSGSEKGESSPVRESMSHDLPTVSPDMTLADATEQILDHGTGCLLVVRNKRLVGVVTERDLLRASTWSVSRAR